MFHLGTLQPHHPKPVTLLGLIEAKMQESALGFIKLHFIGLCPFIQVSLQSPPTFQQIDPFSQLSVSVNLLRKDSIPSSVSSIKILNRTGPSTDRLRDITGDGSHTGCSTLQHHSLGLAIWECSCPSHRLQLFQGMLWETASRACWSPNRQHPQPFLHPPGGSLGHQRTSSSR